MSIEPLFDSFFLAGFECSSYVRHDRRRLDLIAATHHDRLALGDYRLARQHGMSAARDGLRWHLIETTPGHYDFSSLVPMLRAARHARVEVVWDLLHYGWPDDMPDVFSPRFVERFAAFARAATDVIANESDGRVFVCPVNEVSFFSWACGEKGHWYPPHVGRGDELKRHLVRVAVAGVHAVREVAPEARILWAEPAIHVVHQPHRDPADAEAYRLSQFQALDMLAGREAPELGGHPDLVDVVGVNFYPHNQWYHDDGPTIPLGGCNYRPFRQMLAEFHERYRRPVIVAETGAECSGRAAWLHYVCEEVRAAARAGVPVGGICLYPVTEYPGWSNERPVPTGMFSAPDEHGRRQVDVSVAAEVARQAALFQEFGQGLRRSAA
jgi:beta-glucosidase/6-phospho-beta-glucosidase/beta-galactosidase